VERDEHDRPSRFVSVITDETRDMRERSAVDAELAGVRSVTGSAHAILWAERTEAPGSPARYTYLSEECFAATGYHARELMDEVRHFYRLIHDEDVDRVREGWRRAMHDPSGTWEDEYRVRHRDGSVRWLRAFGRRSTPDGTYPAEWRGITIDVTHLHGETPTDLPSSVAADVDG
jgi:PAS domain S-box-containing protein